MSESWDDNDELCGEFCSESRDMLAEVEPVLLELEGSSGAIGEVDPGVIDSIFRAFHSMKGSAGFLGLDTIVSVTHSAESLLDLFRQEPALLRSEHVTALCRTMDFVNVLLDQVEVTFNDGGHEEEGRAIAQRLEVLIESTRPGGGKGGAVPEASPAADPPSVAASGPTDEIGVDDAVAPVFASAPVRPADASEADRIPLATRAPDERVESDEARFEKPAPPAATVESPSLPEAASSPGPIDAASGSEEPGGPIRRASPAPGAKASKGTIRVDLERLDHLMDLVGELILAETMVTHSPDVEGLHLPRFEKAAVHLNRITRSLQDVAMSTRMIPIGATFRKMLRVVRDLARKQGKEVELELAGEETEIDKTVVEAIGDPLVHIVRNSVDHGIEMPDVRNAAGKPRMGRVRLEARHQGGEIWILIEDDGKGLDREAILAKAVSRGLIDEEAAQELRDPEIFRFVFEAGFSTASKVTDVSGRGVGMDVVRRNIENLGGKVEIASELGVGTQITIRLPLTLAIIEGMLVRVGDLVYTLPLLSIRESIPIETADVTRLNGGGEMVRVREGLIPMLRLHDYHGVEARAERLEDGIAIVVEDQECFCLFVDEVIGQRQTVIKGLPAYLGSLRGVSGCSILSDGDISLILDVSSIEGDLRASPSRGVGDE
ncbi:MAG: chemotaxis protein CheA [Myxococcales bacterium]|nr:chemotaxis protein CheA [Myxococcales bacterium]